MGGSLDYGRDSIYTTSRVMELLGRLVKFHGEGNFFDSCKLSAIHKISHFS